MKLLLKYTLARKNKVLSVKMQQSRPRKDREIIKAASEITERCKIEGHGVKHKMQKMYL